MGSGLGRAVELILISIVIFYYVISREILITQYRAELRKQKQNLLQGLEFEKQVVLISKKIGNPLIDRQYSIKENSLVNVKLDGAIKKAFFDINTCTNFDPFIILKNPIRVFLRYFLYLYKVLFYGIEKSCIEMKFVKEA